MATFLTPKAPTEVVERRWLVPVDSDDSALSASLSASGVTVDANSFDGDELVLTLSAGSAAATGSIVATVTTAQGRTLVETLYIPVIASGGAAETALDVITFATRKLTGLSTAPSSTVASFALECLEDMLSEWRTSGADIGATSPLATSTVIYGARDVMRAVKNNLIVEIAHQFGLDLDPGVVARANHGLQHIKQGNLPDERSATYY